MPVKLLYKNSVPSWTVALVLMHIHLSFTMCVLCITAVLSLLSVRNAEPLPCEEIVRPLVLDDISKVSGKWIVIESVVDHPKFVAFLKFLNSSWMEVVPTNDSDTVIHHTLNMINGTCVYSMANVTVSNTTIHFTLQADTEDTFTATLLRTSADYMVMFGNFFINGDSAKSFHLFGRTGKLINFDRETYDRQMDCLAIPKPVFIYDGHQELCPDKNSHNKSSERKPQHEESA